MAQTELITSLYKALWENQDLIEPPPDFSLTLEEVEQDPDEEVMMQDLVDTACSLLEVEDPNPEAMAASLDKKYPSPTSFWRLLLGEVIGLMDPTKRPRLDGTLLAEGKQALKQLNNYLADRDAIIAACEEKIKAAKFPVDAHALLLNYINMAAHQPDKAWELLTTTPAYFSPIITTDEKGKTIISADKGKRWNDELAQFLKNLTI
ncbi:MAG: hypothetical protein ILP11_01700 [Alphaproteobacteria bacterium]|nr:hypothetical protein [Alphaproteobacteria bacterium]